MTPELVAVRSSRVVVVSVVAAAIAVTACALVAIAVMLGWVGSKGPAITPASVASPGLQVAGTDPEAGLAPGETLVAPAAPAPAKPGPMTPNYSPPAAPRPAPTAPGAAAPAVKQPVPRAPVTPTYAQARPRDGYCVNCGTVSTVTTYPDFWEVGVRFEDGSSRNVRYPTPPNLRLGDRVRLEDGRLNRY
jgi:hypothetical protein